MDEVALAHFKQQLEALQGELEQSLAHDDASADSIAPDKAIGRLTRLEAMQAQEMSAAGRRRVEARLQRVQRALRSIAEGTYGTCVRCGGEIPKGRLEVMPESRRCVACAARGR